MRHGALFHVQAGHGALCHVQASHHFSTFKLSTMGFALFKLGTVHFSTLKLPGLCLPFPQVKYNFSYILRLNVVGKCLTSPP